MTDHLKKGGAKALGAAGFVVGLFAPPLLLSTAVGAAFGAGLGKVAESKVKSQIEKQAEQTIPWGGAGLIVAYPRSRERSRKGPIMAKSSAEGDGQAGGASAPEESQERRDILPIPDVTHVGLTTYDAKDPDTSYPPIRDVRPPAARPMCWSS